MNNNVMLSFKKLRTNTMMKREKTIDDVLKEKMETMKKKKMEEDKIMIVEKKEKNIKEFTMNKEEEIETQIITSNFEKMEKNEKEEKRKENIIEEKNEEIKELNKIIKNLENDLLSSKLENHLQIKENMKVNIFQIN
jgi:hypothetical protein